MEWQGRYQQMLLEMKDRLETRPLLLERISSTGTQKLAESIYIEALKKAGLSESACDTT